MGARFEDDPGKEDRLTALHLEAARQGRPPHFTWRSSTTLHARHDRHSCRPQLAGRLGGNRPVGSRQMTPDILPEGRPPTRADDGHVFRTAPAEDARPLADTGMRGVLEKLRHLQANLAEQAFQLDCPGPPRGGGCDHGDLGAARRTLRSAGGGKSPGPRIYFGSKPLLTCLPPILLSALFPVSRGGSSVG